MTIESVREFLGWCSVMNVGLLCVWALAFIGAHDWMHKVHGKLFALSSETFDTVHYGAIAFFKIVVFVFNIVPYLALCLMG